MNIQHKNRPVRPADNRLVSIVTPVHNEAQNILPFYSELLRVLQPLPNPFELIFVDDGSTDDSVKHIKSLARVSDVKLRLIQLSRNFGKEVSLTAGIEAATGDAVLLIDSDMQHPIDKIPEFIRAWNDGNEVVIGVRTRSVSETRLKRYGSKTYYRIMNRIGETRQIPHSTDFRLLDRIVVDAFSRFTERQRITRGLIDWLGFKRAVIYFQANERRHGTPSYDTFKLIQLAIDSFTSHSLLPLRFAGYLGAVITILSGFLGVFTFIEVYLLPDPLALNPSGTALLAILLLFLVGIILSCLGIIATYIARINGEVANRPLYVVREDTDI